MGLSFFDVSGLLWHSWANDCQGVALVWQAFGITLGFSLWNTPLAPFVFFSPLLVLWVCFRVISILTLPWGSGCEVSTGTFHGVFPLLVPCTLSLTRVKCNVLATWWEVAIKLIVSLVKILWVLFDDVCSFCSLFYGKYQGNLLLKPLKVHLCITGLMFVPIVAAAGSPIRETFVHSCVCVCVRVHTRVYMCGSTKTFVAVVQ